MNALNCSICGKMIAYNKRGMDVLDGGTMCSYCIAYHKAVIRELIEMAKIYTVDYDRLNQIEDEYL